MTYTASSRATFDAFLSSTDMNAVTIAEQGPVASRKGSFDRVGRWRRRLGSHRHDLLVALRVINSIERGMVDAEWEGWLEEENMKCKHMKTLMRQNRTAPSDSGEQGGQQPSGMGSQDRTRIMSWHGVYCGSCAQEKELLVAKQVESAKG